MEILHGFPGSGHVMSDWMAIPGEELGSDRGLIVARVLGTGLGREHAQVNVHT